MAALAGCCGPAAPPAEKFFDRSKPLETLRGFVYAVDTHQWDYAYNCLSDASKAEIGQTKFEIAIGWLNDPYYHKVPVFDIISASLGSVKGVRDVGPGRAEIWVIPNVRDADGILNAFEAYLLFVEDAGGSWYFDFFETVNAMLRSQRPGPAEVSLR